MEKIISEQQKHFMSEAVRLSLESVRRGTGPFGAVLVRSGQIIATGSNRVTEIKDPTAHAEIVAIRQAAQALADFDLSGCDLYTSCEPCPMCLAAAYWARLKTIYFANTKSDATKAGFDDELIYRELSLPVEGRRLEMHHVPYSAASEAFEIWLGLPDKITY